MLVDGFPMRIRGENEKQLTFKGGLQLILDTENTETLRLIEKYLDKNKEKKEHNISESLDKLSNKNVNALYEVLMWKLSNIYKSRPANPSKLIIESHKKFMEAENLYEKIKLINEIINLLRCDMETKANLIFIGGTAKMGNIAVSKNTLGKVKVIHQSVTGLFETRKEI